MGFCVLGVGDCDKEQSVTVKNTIDNNVSMSATVSTALNTAGKTDTNTTNLNEVSVQYGLPDVCCPGCSAEEIIVYDEYITDNQLCKGGFTISQKNAPTVSVYSELDDQSYTDMVSNLQSQISTLLDENFSNMQQDDINTISKIIGSASSQTTDVKNTINTSISQSISQSFTKDVVNSVITNTFNKNDASIIACGPISDAPCVISQENLPEIQVSNVLSAFSSVVQSSSAISALSNAVEMEITQEEVGIIGGIAQIMKQFGVYIIGGIVAFILLLIIILVIYLVFRKKD